MMKVLNVRLHVVSPVHIGCGDVYEPTAFVIDESRKCLIDFDPIDFIRSLSLEERQMLTAICMQGSISSIVSLYKFMSGKNITGREVEIASGLLSHYRKVRSLPTNDERKVGQELNQFAIGRTVYNPHSGLPYVPGSSIKGALRTAYLSKLAREQGEVDCWNKYLQRNELESDQKKYDWIGKRKVAKRLEIDLLHGDFESDPFRMVKVSDFVPAVGVKTRIVYAVNKKKRSSKFPEQGPPQIVETISDGSVFEGMINIQQTEQQAGIRKPIAMEELLKSANDLYIPAFDQEDKILKGIDVGGLLQRTKQRFDGKLGKTAYLLRIGRHSGAEAVTIEGNRHIKIMQGRGNPAKFLDHATTIWLASETSKPTTNRGLLPFGWAVLEIVDKLTERRSVPVSATASTPDVPQEASPETDSSDSLMEKLLREVARCRQASDKSILVQTFEGAKELPTAKREEFLKKAKEVLPSSMKQNAKIKIFLRQKEAELIGSE